MSPKLLLSISFLFICSFVSLGSFELELYGLAAERGAFFINFSPAAYNFGETAGAEGFDLSSQEISFDYIIPFFFPISVGGFFKVPTPNLRSFGPRIGLHPNIGLKNVDIYALYVHDFGYLRNADLSLMDDALVEPHYYDIRAGVRYVFNLFCIAVESNYKFSGVNFVFSVKIN